MHIPPLYSVFVCLYAQQLHHPRRRALIRNQQAMLVVHAYGGDCLRLAAPHGYRSRTPWMGDVRRMLTGEITALCAQVLLRDNPEKILKNEPLEQIDPEWFYATN